MRGLKPFSHQNIITIDHLPRQAPDESTVSKGELPLRGRGDCPQERMRVVAAARFEGLLDHDVEHGEALKGVKIVHHHNASHDDAAKANTPTELE